jgi:hypothetical protein
VVSTLVTKFSVLRRDALVQNAQAMAGLAQQIAEMLPHVTEEQAALALRESGGEPELAIDRLLEHPH